MYSFLYQSFYPSIRANRGIWSKRVFIRKIGNFSFSVRWRITMIIHDFLLAQKVLNIFLETNVTVRLWKLLIFWETIVIVPRLLLSERTWYFWCKDVNLYNTRKRYAVIETLDLMRNITWLANCFSSIKKPNKHCSGNQSVIAGVCMFDTVSYIYP